MITSNVVLSDRLQFQFFYNVALYIGTQISPLPISWYSTEGYWPGAQLNSQEKLHEETTVVVQPDRAIVIRPTSTEIEERASHTWRLDTPVSNIYTKFLMNPFFKSDKLLIYLKFLRVRTNFEIDIVSQSPVYSWDIQNNILRFFNNKFRYMPSFSEYPLVIPIKLIQTQKPEWYELLLQSPQVQYMYIGTTGEYHYGFNLPSNPLIRLSGSPSYSVSGETYTVTCPFEMHTSIPVMMLWEDMSAIETIYWNAHYDDIYDTRTSLVTNEQGIGFIPSFWVTLQSVGSTVYVYMPKDEFFYVVLDSQYKYVQTQITVTKVMELTKFKIDIEITDPRYSSPEYFRENPPTLYVGFRRVQISTT